MPTCFLTFQKENRNNIAVILVFVLQCILKAKKKKYIDRENSTYFLCLHVVKHANRRQISEVQSHLG